DGRIDACIVRVLSSRADAGGLALAQAQGLPTTVIESASFADRAAYDAALAAQLEQDQPDIVVLAGFMRILTPAFVVRWLGRLLNIHPSLLPRHPGLHTHQRALEAGDREHGATVHFVTAELDAGPGIIQGKLNVRAEDTADALADRVMQDIELKIYPQALSWLVKGDIIWREGVVLFRGQPLLSPLGFSAMDPAFL
ncbi:MAG TPA: phosphoribosylglycinamide formyltransferase, partial [Fontimonas sp.]